MRGVDFSAAELWRITYSDNCGLTDLILPEGGEYILISDWHAQLRKALSKIQTDKEGSSPEILRLKDWIEIELVHAKTQPTCLLNRLEIREDVGEINESILMELWDIA